MERFPNNRCGLPDSLTVHSTVLDIIVVWHPENSVGASICDALMDHYHSERFSGFAGSAVEVYGHSSPFPGSSGAPAPIIMPRSTDGPAASGGFTDAAPYTAILPVIDEALIRASCDDDSPWKAYLRSLLELRDSFAEDAGPVLVLPLFPSERLDYSNAPLICALMARQGIDIGASGLHSDAPDSVLEHPGDLIRDISQAVLQKLFGLPDGAERLTVFISHARSDIPEGEGTAQPPVGVLETTKKIIKETHLAEFVDARDIQAGDDWDATIRRKAGSGALLMLRTDHYSSREWTQWEVLSAKRAGIPIVCLNALKNGEERGSFLLDHMPVLPYAPAEADGRGPSEENIRRALNRLIDEALKHALWRHQPIPSEVARRRESRRSAQGLPVEAEGAIPSPVSNDDFFDVAPPTPPEPLMLTDILREHKEFFPNDKALWLIHPDPPLLPPEHAVMTDLCALSGYEREQIHLLTPRTYFAAGGSLRAGAPILSNGDFVRNRPLAGRTLGVSMAASPECESLGLRRKHLSLAIAEVAQVLLLAGGRITFAGAVGTHDPDLTLAVVDTINRYVEAAKLEQHRRRGTTTDHAAALHIGPMFILTPPRTVLRSEADISRLKELSRGTCSTGEIFILDEQGKRVALDDAAPWNEPREGTAKAMNAIRRALPEFCDARLVIGGKTRPHSREHSEGYTGSLPGIIEEALHTVRKGQPLYVAGGFGGAGALLAHELGLTEGVPIDSHAHEELRTIDAYRKTITEIKARFNRELTGLDESDLRALASTKRACDMAGLVVKGMIRHFPVQSEEERDGGGR